MTRRRDQLIDRKIGSVIRMQRVKLAMSQTDLGNALGVTFQQIQKYENGTNAVASTRISDLCRALEMTPNDLFGASSQMDGEVSKLSSWAMKIALKLQDASPAPATSNRCHAQRGVKAISTFGLNTCSWQYPPRLIALGDPGRSPANIGRAAQSLRRGHRRSPSAHPVDYVNLKLLAVRCEAATPVNVTLSLFCSSH